MAKFRTAYDHPFVQPVRTFPMYQPEYRMEFNKETLQDELVEVGQVNLSALKLEAAKDCNIYNQIDRFNRTGDDSFLGTSVPCFIDATKMPQSFLDVKNIEARAHQLWQQAPLEIRERYGSSYAKFMQDLDSRLSSKRAEDLKKQRETVVSGGVSNA